MRFQASPAPTGSRRAQALVLFRGDGDRAIPSALAGALRDAAAAALRAKEFTGRKNESLLVHGGGARLLLVGLGDRKTFGPDALRGAAGAAARQLEARGIADATFLVPDGKDAAALARAVTEGAGLAAYRFDACKSKRESPRFAKAAVAPESGRARLADAVAEGSAIVDAVSFARDLGNLPPNTKNAVYLAAAAKKLAGGRLSVRIHDRRAIERMRMGAFAAVAQASANEPRLIEIRYRGAPRGPVVALVGKGVTFDTGGISIKPAEKMEEMKFDMCGGAAVLGLVHLLRSRKPRVNVLALVPATDNMPGGDAYRPGDIVRARNGKTIEIISTDAEGRMLLCDALAYAAESKPSCMVDLATLTGACVVALGDAAAGLFSTDDALKGQIEEASRRSGERVWPMPLFPRYTEMMRSNYADLKNAGGRYGGACTAAAFLKEFVASVPWAHLDIAGTAWTDKDQEWNRVGATGYGVRLLWEFLKARA
ncbi:MAG TPA: leucyl aminopeptidase [Planctomycetota bacterium]|nr:leucyl aminopeptidase [Planctomycetota bacterium]